MTGRKQMLLSGVVSIRRSKVRQMPRPSLTNTAPLLERLKVAIIFSWSAFSPHHLGKSDFADCSEQKMGYGRRSSMVTLLFSAKGQSFRIIAPQVSVSGTSI